MKLKKHTITKQQQKYKTNNKNCDSQFFSFFSFSSEDDFPTIVIAVEEGRRMFANIRKFIVFYLGGNVSDDAIIKTVSIKEKRERKKEERKCCNGYFYVGCRSCCYGFWCFIRICASTSSTSDLVGKFDYGNAIGYGT